jgi:ribosomal protein L32
MLVRALVIIDLKLDGTWKIVQMHSAKPEDLLPETGKGDGGPSPTPTQDLLDNAKRVREERKNWKVAHCHCSICGACGKKRTTHRRNADGHYHVGEPYTGDKCKEE